MRSIELNYEEGKQRMKVQEVKLENNQRRYLLVDNDGLPIIPVAKYLKSIDYRKVNINILSDFVGGLRNPHQSNKVLNIKPAKARRTEKTINLTITVVTNFYDYL